MNKKIILGIILVIAFPIIVYTISPLFVSRTIDEAIPTTKVYPSKETQSTEGQSTELIAIESGSFVGVGDGIHNAKGTAKILSLADDKVLRFENFKATNGPDLYVYLATDEKATDFVNLGPLKANIGNQNYQIPKGTDLTKYDTALVWCKQFSVLFGHANLS